MIDMKKIQLLPGILIIFVLLAAGCVGPKPPENTTVQPTVSPGALPTTPAPLPVTGNVTPQAQLPTTAPAVVPVSKPVATPTLKPLPAPATSSIYIESAGVQIFPLSWDSAGQKITKGNITIQGVIQSTSGYPLQVLMRVDLYGTFALPDTPNATAYDTVMVSPYGISGFTFLIPEYTLTHDTYHITVENVSIAA